MPLGYLDSNNQDIAAMGGLGENFARALSGIRRMQVQQMLEGQRIGIEQQYLRLAQEKASRETQAFGEEQTMRKMQRGALTQASENMGRLTPIQITPTSTVDEHLAQINLKKALAMLAYSSPSVAGRALEPQVYREGETAYDPVTMARIAQGPGMSDYHRAVLNARMQHDQALESIASERASDYRRSLEPRMNLDIADLGYRQYRSAHPEQFTPGGANADLARAIAQQISGGETDTIPAFDSEEAARKAGHKAGSIIRIKGVGKVKLN